MDLAEHRDRRHAGTRAGVFRLTERAVERFDESGERIGEIQLDHVGEVRLAVELAGQTSQVVCRIKDNEGHELAFGSMFWKGPGRYDSTIDTFQPFLRALHQALLPHRERIRFVEGQTVMFMLVMFATGTAIAVISALAFVYIFLMRENAYGLALLLGVFVGGALMRIFWPKGPKA